MGSHRIPAHGIYCVCGTRKMKVCDRTKGRRRNSCSSPMNTIQFFFLCSLSSPSLLGSWPAPLAFSVFIQFGRILHTLALDIYLRPFIIVTITSQELFPFFFFFSFFSFFHAFAYRSTVCQSCTLCVRDAFSQVLFRNRPDRLR